MTRFILHWLDGHTETVEGRNIADAFTSAGYGHGALKALDYYEPESQQRLLAAIAATQKGRRNRAENQEPR